MPSIVFMLVAYAWNISVTSRGDLKVEVLAIVAFSQAANFRTNVLSINRRLALTDYIDSSLTTSLSRLTRLTGRGPGAAVIQSIGGATIDGGQHGNAGIVTISEQVFQW